MALIPSFEINLDDDSKGVQFVEKTGTYSASNTGGWGSPNPLTSSVVSSQLVIKNITDATSIITYDAITITASSTYGNITDLPTTSWLVSGTSIGDISIPDGLYSFTWTLNDGSTTHTKTTLELLTPDICCKLKQLAKAYSTFDGACCENNPYFNLVLIAEAETTALDAAFECFDTTTIKRKIQSLNTYLAELDCPNC